jgi:hypothetical protein
MSWPPPPSSTPAASPGAAPDAVKPRPSLWDVLSSESVVEEPVGPPRSAWMALLGFAWDHTIVSLVAVTLLIGAGFAVTNAIGLTNTDTKQATTSRSAPSNSSRFTMAESGCYEDDPTFFDYSAIDSMSSEAEDFRARGWKVVPGADGWSCIYTD